MSHVLRLRLARPRRNACSLLAGCEANTAPAIKSERPVQVQRVAFESENAGARIRRRGAGALRDRSRLPRRRQDRHPHGQCRRPRARRRRRGAARSAGPAAAGRKRRGRACRRDVQPRAGRRRSRALHHAARARLSRRSRTSTARSWRRTKPKAALERAKRSLDLARNQLAYAELKADADGVITATLAEPGQVVAIGQAVARLAHRGEKEAVVALPETWLGEARKAQATVRLWSDRERSFDGAPARALAAGRSGEPHLCGALHHPRRRRHGRVRHDGDRHAGAAAGCAGRAAAARPRSSIAAPARWSTWSTRAARWCSAR